MPHRRGFVAVTFLYRGAADTRSVAVIAREWLAGRIATSPRRPVHIYMEVGTLEDVSWERSFPDYATPTVLLSNRHLRDVLDAKGYPFTYHEYNGPHDSIVWRGTFGDALVSLLNAKR